MLPELGLILDAGTGIFRARPLIATNSLDILLTHVHLDHVIGLTFLYNVVQNQELDRVTVHVAPEKIEAITEHLFTNLLFPVGPNFDIQPFDDRPFTLNDGGRVTTIPLEHPGGSLGFRIDWPDRSMAYITDTMASSDAPYIKAISGVDTLIHECYFPDGEEELASLTGHSCLTPVAQVARLAKAGNLFLVHINPLNETDDPLDLASVRDIYGNISVAFDGQVIDV